MYRPWELVVRFLLSGALVPAQPARTASMSGRRSRDRFIRRSLEIVLPFTQGGEDLYRRRLIASGQAGCGTNDVDLLRTQKRVRRAFLTDRRRKRGKTFCS
ncbi:hypothetical protein G6F40_017484 [Rhizopus arrhizus]|nr:hypothetical protein G6F40_017484 [Rhizopus arrhizus]